MSVVGVFSRAQPSIGGFFFDAVLEESTELASEVTQYPIENGALGSDHVALKPMMITMLVGVSDNPFRALTAAAGVPIAGSLAGTAVGGLIGQASGEVAAAVGVAGSVANAAYSAGQASTRSQTVLEQLRALQSAGVLLDVVGAKGKTYTSCLIRNTREATTKENEQGLELVVELVQPLITYTERVQRGTRTETLPANDSASAQAQPLTDYGEVSTIA